MPLFFFDVHDAGHPSQDTEGTEFPDQRTAIRAAVELLPSIAHNKSLGSDGCNLVVEVRDEAGRPFFTATLSLVTKHLC